MFPKGKDCTLSKLGMANPSLFTNTSAVSECPSYPTITDLDGSTADYPYYPSHYYHRRSAINRDPHRRFL